MPFTCEISLDASQLQRGPLTFDAWLDEAWGRYVPAGTPFARAHDDHGTCVLELAGPGVLSFKSQLKPGDRIEPGTIVARYQTDGEDIIYGKSACRVVYV